MSSSSMQSVVTAPRRSTRPHCSIGTGRSIFCRRWRCPRPCRCLWWRLAASEGGDDKRGDGAAVRRHLIVLEAKPRTPVEYSERFLSISLPLSLSLSPQQVDPCLPVSCCSKRQTNILLYTCSAQNRVSRDPESIFHGHEHQCRSAFAFEPVEHHHRRRQQSPTQYLTAPILKFADSRIRPPPRALAVMPPIPPTRNTASPRRRPRPLRPPPERFIRRSCTPAARLRFA